METSIYRLLMFQNPQALQNLDQFQHRWHHRGISMHKEVSRLVTFDYQGVGEDYDKEMRIARSRE